MDSLVSVIIPVFNRGEFLRHTVESVLAQTYRPIEIIISDDGSEYETVKIAKSLVEENSEIVRLIRNPHRGAGLAREVGRRAARGQYLQYLDSDDRLVAEKFEVQVAALECNPECGAAYGRTRLINEDGDVIAETFKWTGRKFDYLFPALLVDRWWCTHTPLYRRSVTDAVGPWSNLQYSQDWEYDARVGALKTRLLYCDKLVSEHRTHMAMRQTGRGRWLSSDERIVFFRSLYECAVQAGVTKMAPEMQHFARWVFAEARKCGFEGNSVSGRKCLKIAREASGGRSYQMAIYGVVASVIGWKGAHNILQLISVLAGRRYGSDTLKQSWM